MVTLAQDALIFYRLGGVESAVAVVRERKGSAYAPHLVECFCQQALRLCQGFDTEISWDMVVGLEPGVQAGPDGGAI
ncbi:MAG: hypothetical protein U0401_25790 [Anaerolineae bacterium]